MSAFCSVDASAKALFKSDTYKVFKKLETLIAPNLGCKEGNSFVATDQFVMARDAAVKAMYEEVIGN